MSGIFNSQHGKNWVYISVRLLMLIGFSIAIYAARPRPITSFAAAQDIAIPAIVGVAGALVVGAMAFIKALRPYAAYAVMLADWTLVGTYVYFGVGLNPLLTLGIAGTIAVSGTLRLGPALGLVNDVGVFVTVGVALSLIPSIGFDEIRSNLPVYAPGFVIALVMAVMANLWYNALDDENASKRRQVRGEIEESRSRLEHMRERAKAFSEMATRLNETLNYDRILDAAMDIGRNSIKDDARQRVVSLAIMVKDADEMEIASARGLQHIDVNHTFEGKRGIIAQAMEEGRPIIVSGGDNDPELKKIKGFIGMKTTLCIPLRAHYETYGVLVFGSSAENAIHEDHIDTLEAIGVQTSIALRNAVLYANLREEKERIIQIEENGRRALVRDLHDIPTQTVSAVAMHLSTLPVIVERDPSKLRDEVENIRQMALRATEEIRHVMFTLRPLSLESQGLSTALDQLADKMQKTYKQAMQAKVDPRVERCLTREAQGTLFYLIEEAANNARKYAEASMIQVRATIEDDQVVVRVRDNGKGFETDSVNANYENRGSFGMVNMRERAELINATFELQSAPGKGTQVTVRVPVEGEIAASETPTDPPLQPRRALKKKEYSGPLSPST